jgi:hypothetical protein
MISTDGACGGKRTDGAIIEFNNSISKYKDAFVASFDKLLIHSKRTGWLNDF